MTAKTFDAMLIKDEGSGGAGVIIPFDVQEAFGRNGPYR